MVDALPNTRTGRIIGDQLGRSGTSVGANYRAACRARSKRELIAKIGVVEEEADEAPFLLGLTAESGAMPARKVQALLQESNELVAIMASSRITAARSMRQ